MSTTISDNLEVLRSASSAPDNRLARSVRWTGSGAGIAVGGTTTQDTPADPILRQRVDELVGQTFFGTLLRTMRSSCLKGPYGHGGRGEEVFGSQLDMLLAEQVGRSARSSLNEAIYRRLVKTSPTWVHGGTSQ